MSEVSTDSPTSSGDANHESLPPVEIADATLFIVLTEEP